jgi:tetratricopeptide (TPR) repeat protein
MAQAADFFVSYTGADRAWAEWIAWQLEAEGYTVVVQAWDFIPGRSWTHEMQQATATAERVVLVLSAAYLQSEHGEAEWQVFQARDPLGKLGLLLPARVGEIDPPGLLKTRIYVDLVGRDAASARSALLAAARGARGKPAEEPEFPGRLIPSPSSTPEAPRYPGRRLVVTNLPPRNPDFSGRDTLLTELHERLMNTEATAVVQAATVHGLGGVGKTQLALEYAYRYGTDYDVMWWVPAEQPVAIPGWLAGLARRLGVPEQADQAELLASLWDVLRQRDRWLLIYDNAEGPRELAPYRPPAGGGRVLATSRASTWDRGTATVRLDVLDRDEAVAFLRRRIGSSDTATVAALAEALGDLPLALEQAAAYMDETHTLPADYLALYREHSAELLALGEPLTTEQTVATTWQVALDRVRATIAAQELLSLCAFLAPDDIPRALLPERAEVLPEPLRGAVARRLAYNQAISAIGRYSLVTVTAEAISAHRLVQAVVRHGLNAQAAREWTTAAVRLVGAGFPEEAEDVKVWPIAARLLPHALAATDHAAALGADPTATSKLLHQAGRYLWGRAEHIQAKTLHQRALEIRETYLGADHLVTAQSLHNLGLVLQELGDLDGARTRHRRALQIREAHFGPDHPQAANSLNQLGRVLYAQGDLDGARPLLERALRIREEQLGADHPQTASSLNQLGRVLYAQGDLDGARPLLERALRIREAQLGADHPDTAESLNDLALALAAQGDLSHARSLHERALSILETRLGPDHPQTAKSRRNLAVVLRNLKGWLQE